MSKELYQKLSREKQIERRRQKGVEELVKIVNQGGEPVYSTFEVTSTSQQVYTVQIHSLTDQLNTCTCPDYLTNTIGTCKHIEGVLANLQKEFASQWDKLAARVSPVIRIYVHHAGLATVRMSLPPPKKKQLTTILNRYFDNSGILQGKITQSLPALLDELNRLPGRKGVIVDRAVHEYLAKQQEIEEVRQQKEWFLDQVKQGNRSLSLLSTPLYPYQEEGVLHLTFGHRTLLADDMGLGKTIQAIAAACLLKQLRDIRHVLVVTPASLKHQWAREISHFTSLSAQVIQGNQIERRQLYRNLKFFNIVNYELVRHDEKEIAKHSFDLVILDEAQRIKNWRTKTATCVKRLLSPYAFVLTGTPLENRLDELFSVFQFIDPTILGPLWRFNQRYYHVKRRPSGSFKVEGYKNLDELRRRIAPYVLRRVRHEVQLDLPERVDSNFFVEMTAPQMTAYDEYEYRVARLMATAQRRPLTPEEHNILLGCMIKMRLICNALALHDPEVRPQDHIKTSPKLRELREILSEEVAGNGQKAVIFSQWSGMLALTEPILKKLGIRWVKLTGDVPSAKRGALIDRFFEDPDCKVFLSTDAGGVGLNLQAASMVINLDLPWNPAVLEQRIARAHRQRQKNTVNVVNLIAKGTIEERLLDTLDAKRAVFDAAFQSESTVTELSFKDAGQGVLQRLEVMLGVKQPAAPELALTPTAAPAGKEKPTPTMRELADIMVGRFPGRILLVRTAPQLPGVQSGNNLLVVVEHDPSALRPSIEQIINDHYGSATPPGLLLMEQEGYRALTALTGGSIEQPDSGKDYYHAPSIAIPDQDEKQKARDARLKQAREGFNTADKRLSLASVMLQHDFPEEVLRPLRQALGFALTAHLALANEQEPSDTLPSPHLVEKELVRGERIPVDLAARLDRIRVLTSESNEDAQPASPFDSKTAEEFIGTIRELIDLGRELIVKQGL